LFRFLLLAPVEALTLLLMPRLSYVRVHTALVGDKGRAWLKLWYLCRSLDAGGRGYVEVSIDYAAALLDRKVASLYQWLLEGREVGAFRRYTVRNGVIRVWLGGLFKICQNLGLESFGHVGEVDPLDLKSLRTVATSIATQALQNRSRTAARRSLNTRERKFYRFLEPVELLERISNPSQIPDRGVLPPAVLAIGRKFVFVSKSFIPFGVSQEAIADHLQVSDRTVRRHLTLRDVPRRQIAQGKQEYGRLKHFLDEGATDVYWQIEDDFSVQGEGDFRSPQARVFERNGITSSRRQEGHKVSRGQVFHYRGRTWLKRCNLYALNHHINSMRRSRQRYKSLISQNPPIASAIDKANLCEVATEGTWGQ